MIFPFRFWGGGGLSKIAPNVKEGIRGDHSKNSINKKPPPFVYQYLAEGSVNEVLV